MPPATASEARTALVYPPILFGMAIVAGLRTKMMVWILIVGLTLAPLGWVFLEDYQKERILVTLDAERDPQGVG
ncbi:MAG: FtsW/RodA/SpoVE family cell cycle protein [Acidobacteriota bacterium]